MVEFGEQARITYVMGGMARSFDDPGKLLRTVLDAADDSGMPVDPRLWLDAPPAGSHPACLAVKAAAEQSLDGPYLRVLREGIMCERRKLDSADTLLDAARGVPGLDTARLASDLRSSATVEALGADVARAQAVDAEHHAEGSGRVSFPSFELRGEDGVVRGVYGSGEPGELRVAALAAGGEPGPLPAVDEALRRFGRMATAEVAAVCDLPGPLAAAELWRAASEWRARPQRVLTGELWAAGG